MPSAHHETGFQTNTAYSPVSDQEKTEVAALAPGGKRCLITMDLEPINCYHISPPPLDQLENVERAWLLSPGALQLNIPANLMWLRPDIHASFAAQEWALIPALPILTEIAALYFLASGGYSIAGKFPNPMSSSQETWKYHFVPFRDFPITRLRFNDDRDPCGIHEEPFEDLELLESHIHPYFAIYNAGKKAQYYAETPDDPATGAPLAQSPFNEHFGICRALFMMWNKPTLPISRLKPAPLSQKTSQSVTTGSQLSDSGSQSSRKTQQDRERDERAQRRGNGYKGRNIPNSGPDTGAPSSHECMEVISASNQYLPIPEQSQHPTHDYQCRLGIVSSESNSSHDWKSVVDWVAGVEASWPCQDPYVGYAKDVEVCLVDYSRERARRLPRGPWEKWLPVYEYV